MVVMIKGGLLLFPLRPWRFLRGRNNLWLTYMNWQSLMKCEKRQKRWRPRTLQVQVFGSGRCLRGDLGVDLDGVEVVGVSGDDHVVPVVVVEWLVGVAFDQVGPIPQVGHVVQVTAIEQGGKRETWEKGKESLKTRARKFCCHSIASHSCRGRSDRTGVGKRFLGRTEENFKTLIYRQFRIRTLVLIRMLDFNVPHAE